MPLVDDVVIAGAGIACAVGLSLAEAATAVRSGTARFVSGPLLGHGFESYTLAQVPEQALPPLDPGLEEVPLTARTQRLLRLATSPLRECMRPLPAQSALVPVVLALPDSRSPGGAIDAVRFAELLGLQNSALGIRVASRGRQGRAGGIAAIGDAVAAIRSGRLTIAVAGGVDSYRDPMVLGKLDSEGRAMRETSADAFIPGEGAAFLLLARRDLAVELDLKPLAFLSGVALAEEPGHLYSAEPYRGDGLSAAVSALVRGEPPAGSFREVFLSMNGESHWGKEWGVAYVRNRSAFDADHRTHHPADSFGDLGAACGPALLALAAHGVASGHYGSPALICCSSDGPLRAAVAVRATAAT